MKKIIAIVMALVMMMAVTVPAFAGEIKENTAQNGESLVKTDTSTVGAGSYTVTTQLAVGKTLNVAVADKTSGTLEGTMTATGTADTLVYDLSGDVTGDYDEVSNETKNLTFTVRDWNKTIAEYSNYITFTTTLADK